MAPKRSGEPKRYILVTSCLALLGVMAGRSSAEVPRGLRLDSGEPVNLTHVLQDGEGFRWDIETYGNVGRGSNYAYSDGMYLYVGGGRVSGGRARLSKDGNELEIGPMSQSGLRIWRRIRVYEDQPLARWLEVLENPSSSDITVSVQWRSDYSAPLESVKPVAQADRDEEPWAVVTQPDPRYSNRPSVLHVLCDPRSRLRPNHTHGSREFHVTWDVTVPAGQAVALCTFESQGELHQFEELMQDWRSDRYLKDLSPAARRAIVNFPSQMLFDNTSLERSEAADLVRLRSGDPIYGRVRNNSFRLVTPYGEKTIPARDVVGMVCRQEQGQAVLTVLADGQVVSGELPEQELMLALPDGGQLSFPLDRMAQWSYGVSEDKPAELPFRGPYLVQRDGSRLAYRRSSLSLAFRSRHGRFEIDGQDVVGVRLENDGNGVHSVVFANGSQLAGMLEPALLSASLRLGFDVEIPREMLRRVEMAPQVERDDTLTEATLTNGDTLFGQLAPVKIALQTGYGKLQVQPEGIKTMQFLPKRVGRVVVEMWDASVLRGELAQDGIRFQIAGGPELQIDAGQCVSIERSQALPPQQVSSRVRQLVLMLSSESYAEREEATEQLKQLGGKVEPLLKQLFERAREPEVRRRLQEVLREVDGG